MTTTTTSMTPQEQFIAKTLSIFTLDQIQEYQPLLECWEEQVLENYDPEEDSETGTYSLQVYAQNTVLNLTNPIQLAANKVIVFYASSRP